MLEREDFSVAWGGEGAQTIQNFAAGSKDKFGPRFQINWGGFSNPNQIIAEL